MVVANQWTHRVSLCEWWMRLAYHLNNTINVRHDASKSDSPYACTFGSSKGSPVRPATHAGTPSSTHLKPYNRHGLERSK